MWPYPRLLGIEMPFIQAALGGANGSAMAVAASEADGLGFLYHRALKETHLGDSQAARSLNQ